MRLYKIFFLCAVFAILFLASSASALTEVTDSIDVDTTWVLSESPYLVENTIGILDGATLTIEPGVVVKFGDMASLYVDGVLNASGNIASPIIFTSSKDDSAGGDTNGDGVGTSPSESDWNAVSFGNVGIASTLSHIELRFASQGILSFGSSLSISDALIKYVYQGMLFFDGVTTLKNISFLNISRSAIDLYEGATVDADAVSLTNLGEYGDGVSIFGDSSLILKNASFAGSLGSYGISVYEGSDINIDASIFSGFDTAIADYGSGSLGPDSIKIQNSQIKNNDVGFAFYANNSTFSIIKNTIHGNTIFGAESYSTSNINIKNNFWGDASGPLHPDTNPSGLGNAIFDIPGYSKILFTPWLTSWPSEPAPCCSSVIFVPGFEGSRLYEKNGKKENQLWDPRSPSDISNLFLNNSGISNKNVHTRDIVDSVPIMDNVYNTIQVNLNNLKNTQNLINNWSAYAYDWRLSVSDLIESGTKYDQIIKKLEDEIISLAQNSKTQKVTLVGHSNGGLMIKKVISELKKHSKDHLVDKIILVDSPQLGTPSVLTAMLHGYGTKLGFGLLLREGRAREWLVNMGGAYGLIPSSKLMSKMTVPLFELGTSVGNITNWLTKYGADVDYTDMKNLLTGGDGRTQPNRLNLNIPYVLSPTLLNKSEQLHNEIDNLQIPASIEVHEIAGWGLPTITGIKYDRTPQLFYLNSNINQLRSQAIFTYKGDKEVITDSQVDYGFNKYYLNILGFNNDENTDFSHATIMENPEVLNIINNIITDSSEPTPHVQNELPILPDYATPKYKIISMHSPANIDVYDSLGRHVGIEQDSTNSDLVQIDTNIPNSNFILIGEEKYAIVPDNGENYDVKVTGTGNGLFTLDVETQQGDTIVNKVSYADLPVTKNLEAEVTVFGDGSEAPIIIDHNGDGVVDEEILPNTDSNPLIYLEIIRTTVVDLQLPAKKEKTLLTLIDKVYKLMQKGKIDKATKKVQNFLQRVQLGKTPLKNLTQQERDDLIDKITSFLNSL